MTALTVLQLDTNFPRVPGDIGCAQTYLAPVEIVKIPGADVGNIVTSDPKTIEITPFRTAACAAKGQVVTTSCGFLSYWQDDLAALSGRPFISSALLSLDTLAVPPEHVVICTFNPDKLNARHLRGHTRFADCIIGPPENAHLRQIIEGDLTQLDTRRAGDELTKLLGAYITKDTRHILLECTNMPPYKRQIEQAFGIKTTDILDLIEAARPGTVVRAFLSQL